MEKKKKQLRQATPIEFITAGFMHIACGVMVLFILLFMYDFGHFSLGIVFGVIGIVLSLLLLMLPSSLKKRNHHLCKYDEITAQKLFRLSTGFYSAGAALLFQGIAILLLVHLGISFFANNSPSLREFVHPGYILIGIASIVAVVATAFTIIVFIKFRKAPTAENPEPEGADD